MILAILSLAITGSDLRSEYLHVMKAAAEHYEIDWQVIDSIIFAESAWDQYAISHAGAEGVAQIMPPTAKMLKIKDSFDPGQAIWGCAWYIRMLLDEMGSLRKALASYNAGPNRIKSNRKWPIETKKYVKKICGRLESVGIICNH